MELKQSKKAFLVIEVLISIFIMFLVIVSLAAIVKQKNKISDKSGTYQILYITVKSVINYLDKKDININSTKFVKYDQLNLNGFDVNIFVKLLKSKNNYVTNSLDELNNNKNSNKIINLYLVKLTLKHNNIEKNYYYELTKFLEK